MVTHLILLWILQDHFVPAKDTPHDFNGSRDSESATEATVFFFF